MARYSDKKNIFIEEIFIGKHLGKDKYRQDNRLGCIVRVSIDIAIS